MALITLDGQEVEVAQGATVMDAAHQAGVYIPHFCYHKKLSIAANCRMCLVEVEKAPKPLPACATPVTDGMVVRTHSTKALEAQKGVMEFLLINHPLDCPICDQGGECQLQDIAVGYGDSASVYSEPKRVVKEKDLGPLVATDMTRCIHCTRCVRFGQEIAGIMELGMVGRGEHSEIMPFLEQHVDSELSGNVIELCPVGALTSKPFRYKARPWELSRRKTISPHDSLGTNMALHVKDNRVLRVSTLENEAINDCWIADRDRYAYEALNSDDRLTRPMVKENGQWIEVDWQKALAQASGALKVILDTHGGSALGVLASPHQTVEELFLLQKLARGLGCENIDHRLAQTDFASTANAVPWLGMPVAEVSRLDRVLLIGSTVRKEQPLIAQRLRHAVRVGGQLNVLHAADDNLLCKVANTLIVKPSGMVNGLAQVAKALIATGANVPAEIASQVSGLSVSEAAHGIAASLMSGERKAILLGAWAMQHASFSQVHALAQAIATATGATLGMLPAAANAVGAGVVGCQPGQTGLDAHAMLAQPRKAYLVLGAEPDVEANNAAQAQKALESAELVVVLSAFKGHATDYADVLLPIAAFAENSGSYLNIEGRQQGFRAAVKAQGEARPAWKVLRVLGDLLKVPGMAYDSVEEVLAAALPEGEAGAKLRLANMASPVALPSLAAGGDIERLAETPIYQLDALTRRAPALQKTADGLAASMAWANAELIARLGLTVDSPVKVIQDGAESVMKLGCDATLPADVVRVAGSHAITAGLGPRHGTLRLEKM